MWRVVKRDPEIFWQIEELWQAAIAAQIIEEEGIMTTEEQLTKLSTAKTLVQAVREERELDDEVDDKLDTVTEALGITQDLIDEEVHS